MIQSILKWFWTIYKQTVASIAFIPALIAIFFLLLSFFMVQFDFSESGKDIKSNAHWLTLKDASTARSIISSIVSGIISLTVFSFSMVMILLNQAASQMSYRVLDKLIGNRFQQRPGFLYRDYRLCIISAKYYSRYKLWHLCSGNKHLFPYWSYSNRHILFHLLSALCYSVGKI